VSADEQIAAFAAALPDLKLDAAGTEWLVRMLFTGCLVQLHFQALALAIDAEMEGPRL
jgi:hypothetical protein